MKRFIPLVALFVLFVGLSFTGSPIAPRTLALYDHPAQPGNVLEKSARANGAYTYGIPRPDFYYTVAERRERIIAASWVSPNEGRVYTSRGEGRWHHSQHVRRMN